MGLSRFRANMVPWLAKIPALIKAYGPLILNAWVALSDVLRRGKKKPDEEAPPPDKAA